MSTLFEDLRIESYSVDDRLRLVGDIWDSIVAGIEAQPLTEVQRDEVDRRLAAHRANPDAAIPWEVVERELLERLKK